MTTAYGVHRHRGSVSVAGNRRSIFFCKAATFLAVLGKRDRTRETGKLPRVCVNGKIS